MCLLIACWLLLNAALLVAVIVWYWINLHR